MALGQRERSADSLATAVEKARRRLIPFLFLLYVVAYLDRVNVGFAQLQMKSALGLADAAYGLGAGLFFIGYFLFELPSNLLLARFGPRRWMARIMVTWGVLSSATMFVSGARSFYTLRVLLGLAEAGFFPGMILYLTCWFPPRERAAAVARFMTAIGLSLVVGGPLSGAILDGLHGALGLAGWQWLFLLEGLPAVVLGFVVLAVLPDRPADVRWLSAEEQRALAAALEPPTADQGREHTPQRGAPADSLRRGEAAMQAAPSQTTLRGALADGRVWLLSAIYFLFAMGLYGLTLWVPQIISDVAPGSALRVGLLAAIPYLLAAVGMVGWAQHVGRDDRVRRGLAAPVAVAVAGLASAAALLDAGPLPVLVSLSVGIVGLFSAFGPFWAVPGSFLRGTAAAGGIAVINSCGNLGGFVSPWVVGLVKRHTGSFAGGLGVIAGALLVALVLIIVGVRTAEPGGHPARTAID